MMMMMVMLLLSLGECRPSAGLGQQAAGKDKCIGQTATGSLHHRIYLPAKTANRDQSLFISDPQNGIFIPKLQEVSAACIPGRGGAGGRWTARTAPAGRQTPAWLMSLRWGAARPNA